jgi:hypothetical protein
MASHRGRKVRPPPPSSPSHTGSPSSATNTEPAEDPPAVTPATLDAAMYPHILDAIMAYSSIASLVVLQQTCRAVRKRTRPLLFEHIVFVQGSARPGRACPNSGRGKINILTGPAPHHFLGSFAIKNSRPDQYDVDAIKELSHTRVLDMPEINRGWDLSDIAMPRLRIIRNLPGNYDPTASTRSPRAPTAVGTVHCRWPYLPVMDAPISTSTKHHILHLAWDSMSLPSIWMPRVPAWHSLETRTIILSPYGQGWGPTYTSRGLIECLSWSTAVVGAECLHYDIKQAVSDYHRKFVHLKHPNRPEPEFKTYKEWAGGLEHIDGLAPETMEAFYMKPSTPR